MAGIKLGIWMALLGAIAIVVRLVPAVRQAGLTLDDVRSQRRAVAPSLRARRNDAAPAVEEPQPTRATPPVRASTRPRELAGARRRRHRGASHTMPPP